MRDEAGGVRRRERITEALVDLDHQTKPVVTLARRRARCEPGRRVPGRRCALHSDAPSLGRPTRSSGFG